MSSSPLLLPCRFGGELLAHLPVDHIGNEVDNCLGLVLVLCLVGVELGGSPFGLLGVIVDVTADSEPSKRIYLLILSCLDSFRYNILHVFTSNC